MARTWTLHSTLSILSGGTLPPTLRALTNGAGDTVYFIINGSPQKVYSWNGGASLTDIAGTTFPTTTSEVIRDICLFDGDLFAGYGLAPITTGNSIYRYNSAQSWTEEYPLEAEPAFPGTPGYVGQGIGGVDQFPWPMDCDDNYMAVAGTISSTNTETFRRMWVRDTAGNWAITQMPGSVYPAPGYQLVGKSKGSDYSGLVGFNRLSSSNYQPILIGGPSPWSNLTGAPIGQAMPIGYGNGLSFFSQNIPTGTATWEIKYSNDWGQTLFTAGGLTRPSNGERAEWKFKNFPDEGIIMLATDTNQAYTWDAGTATFIADGTTGSQTIFDFFILNDQLFALTNSGTANSIEMWSAGELGCTASFYYGIEAPQFVSNLPFCVEPGGLAISPETYVAVLGTGEAAGQSVVYQLPPYNLPTWNDISGIVPTGTAVTSIKFV